MMPNPSTNVLTPAYYNAQIERTKNTLERILDANAQAGRVIPGIDDLRIHDGRRIEAVVMFLDISKFSLRPSETSEEQATLMQVLSLFFTEMIRIAEDYSGTIEKNTGDGLMVYFSHEADTASTQQRAVAAAMTMFAAATSILNPILIRSGIPILNFRVCMDHGHITVAKVGAPHRHNQIVAIGTTANVAAKMLSRATANTMLLGNEMLKGLPQEWVRDFVKLHTASTGWSYRQTGEPYYFWEYTGRWKIPA